MCDHMMKNHEMHHGCHHGPHGHGHGHKKELIKNLNKDSVEFMFYKTAHKIMHQSAEDIQNGAPFNTLNDQEKQELMTLLKKLDEAAKAEPGPEKPQEKPAE